MTGDQTVAIYTLQPVMDALPMEERKTVSHRSKIRGIMHGCGHDGHTTMLLGAAKVLAQDRSFDGTVYFIFQPAEEGGGGGLAMIEDGLFEKFPMQSVWGLHNLPTLAAGSIAIHDTVVMAASDYFHITIRGKDHMAVCRTRV